jgi:muramidase (phage lysozyme)
MTSSLQNTVLRAFMCAAVTLTSVVGVAGCAVESEEEDEAAALESELGTNEIVQAGTVLRVTANTLYVRRSAVTSAAVVANLTRNERVTAASTSGGSGWVNVRTSRGAVGWTFGKYLVRADGGSASSGSTSSGGGSCAPSRGQGVVGRYQKALHDAIAFAEGTAGYAKDGYNVMFSHRLMSSCGRHPDQCIRYGRTCTTAAGRYQFLTGTWNSVARARSLGSFEPENQERGTAYLITNVRRTNVPTGRPMTAAEFSNAMSKLSYEWASLPPGRYGQPVKTMSQMRTAYCRAAGC